MQFEDLTAGQQRQLLDAITTAQREGRRVGCVVLPTGTRIPIPPIKIAGPDTKQ